MTIWQIVFLSLQGPLSMDDSANRPTFTTATAEYDDLANRLSFTVEAAAPGTFAVRRVST
jgi:hypothetical protein